MLSEPDRDVENLGGDHKTRRTAAIASLKVGWCVVPSCGMGTNNGAGLLRMMVAARFLRRHLDRNRHHGADPANPGNRGPDRHFLVNAGARLQI